MSIFKVSNKLCLRVYSHKNVQLHGRLCQNMQLYAKYNFIY